MNVDVDRYLNRIGYSGAREPTAATLRALHVAHMCTVPFENLSVRRGERIVLDEAALFDKVVVRRRGGFCYELNGLFAALLESLGFRVDRLAARVGVDGIDFDHMALRVEVGGAAMLADVGFGDSFLTPLALRTNEKQAGGDERVYRISKDYELARYDDGEWKRQYAFTLKPWPLAAFADGCAYHSTSPASHFTQNTVVSLATPTGRVTLSERRLIVTDRGERRETAIDDVAAFDAALARHFGM